MDIHYYKTDSLADAFEMASKDTKTWDVPAMEALAELAAGARSGSLSSTHIGLGRIYACTRGQFKVNFDSKKGHGIALVSLTGRESGIDDPTAAGILEYHRDRPEEELYADQLIVLSENVLDINALDAGYEQLLRARFLVQTDSTVQVAAGDAMVERPKYRLCRPMELIDE
jgi:hypothetical protein